MFNIGDKVVYPMHGAGVIEAIEEQEVLGETKQYYIMRLPIGELKVMIPLKNVERIGLRYVIDAAGVDRVFGILQTRDGDMATSWNRRYRANLERIKTGDVYEVAAVVRNLVLREKEKGLSTGERKMLDNARQILLSELVLAKGMEEGTATSLLEEYIG